MVGLRRTARRRASRWPLGDRRSRRVRLARCAGDRRAPVAVIIEPKRQETGDLAGPDRCLGTNSRTRSTPRRISDLPIEFRSSGRGFTQNLRAKHQRTAGGLAAIDSQCDNHSSFSPTGRHPMLLSSMRPAVSVNDKSGAIHSACASITTSCVKRLRTRGTSSS